MLDNFFELPLHMRTLVYGVIVALLLGGYWWFSHSELSVEIEKNQKQIATLQSEKGELQRQIAKGDKIQDEIIEVQRLFNEVTAQLPEQKEIPELLRQVSNLGRDSGLEVRLFRQQPEVKQTLHAEVPVEMAVRGGYHQIALFFDKVRHLDRIVNIADMSIKNPEPQAGGQPQIESSFFATTYRFLSKEEQEEQRKAAEEKAKKEKGRK